MRRKNNTHRTEHIFITVDSVTNQCVDAIVNNANVTLLGGFGIDGEIHQKAGSELFNECKTLGGCKIAQCKMTNGYHLPCHKIIHAVAPLWKDGNELEEQLLATCYRNVLNMAVVNKFKSIALPCLGIMQSSFHKEQATKIACETIRQYIDEEIYEGDIIVCCDSKNDADMYHSLLPEKYKIYSLFGSKENDLDDVTDLPTQYPKGKEKFQHLQELVRNPFRVEDDLLKYARQIVQACTVYTYDSPIKKELMFEFLERAELEDKKVEIEINEENLPGGQRHDQLDGWEFHPILVDK